jgi:hypothetical protein
MLVSFQEAGAAGGTVYVNRDHVWLLRPHGDDKTATYTKGLHE